MSSRDFVYWLQGYLEIRAEKGGMTDVQVECVKRHLALVFKHEIDPSYGGDPEELQAIHDGPNGIPVTPPHLAAQGVKLRC